MAACQSLLIVLFWKAPSNKLLIAAFLPCSSKHGTPQKVLQIERFKLPQKSGLKICKHNPCWVIPILYVKAKEKQPYNEQVCTSALTEMSL